MKGLKLFISSSLFIISIISGEEIAEVQPSQPLNVTILRVTSTTIYLSWSQPEKPNGQIQGYRLYYMHAMQTHVRSVRNTTASIQFELEHLEPFTEYKIWLKAFTEKHEGLSSEAVLHRTDVRAPSAPTILNLTCQAHDSVLLQWQQPLNYSVSIDYYYITYRDENENNAEEIEVESSKEHLDSTIMIHNLTGNTVYEIKVRAASRSVFDPKVLINGEESQPKRVEIRNDCDQIVNDRRSSSRELSAGMIAGVVCASCSLLLACASFILWRYYLRTSKHERQFFLRQSLLSSYTSDGKKRKCFHAPYYYLDEPPRQSNALVDWDTRAEPGAQKSSVPVHLFSKHVASLHADGDIGFSKEYEAIQSTSTQDEHTSEHSHHPDNKQKNRYLNILAYDHSRVQLLPVPGQKKSIDYVNANYIDGFQRSRAYIGTQGPLPSTFDCFWRMVWEQRVVIIVMITNLVERGRRKCDMYWPKEGIETYGVIQVKLVKEDVMATYTVRTLQIRHLRIRKKKSSINDRIVYQYHYTNWPDHGTPDHPLPVLSFVKKSSAANPTDAGPIIVHCSAGVGRTGTYIVLDSMLKQIRSKGEVNIFGFLRHIRSQRNFLVQTEEQYIFIHDALLEAIESGETNINQSYIGRYINNLQIQENLDEKVESWKLLETQFKNVISFQPKDFNLVSANKSCNQVKNRILDILPIESSRVHLTPKPGIDGSDYVNASWFQGFHKLREFIITQHPLEVTVLDFWQMIWDHNAQTIVLLSSIENEMDQEFKVFWPTENDDLNGENFKVKFIDERDHSTYSMKDLTIHSLQDDYEFSIKLVHYPNWPHIITPNNSVFDLLKVVQDHHSINPNGPIIVMDRFGGTEAASFCCLTTLSKQMEYENHVDVYMYAKLYHNKRPGIWKTQDDYLLLYRWLEAISISKANATPPAPSTAPPDLYLTANGHLNDFHGNGNVRTCIIEMDDSSSTSPKFTN